jgi:hypothetical protein
MVELIITEHILCQRGAKAGADGADRRLVGRVKLDYLLRSAAARFPHPPRAHERCAECRPPRRGPP